MPKKIIKPKKAIKVSSSNPDDLSVEDIKRYISTKTPLSHEEQLWIFRKDPLKRTEKDVLTLIDCHLRLVFKIASDFHKRHLHMSNSSKSSMDICFTDLFQAGVIGLNRAIVLYDSKRKMQFSTYSHYWISVHIQQEIRKNIYPLKTQAYSKVKIVSVDHVPEESDNCNFYSTINFNELVGRIQDLLSSFEFNIFKLYFIDGISVRLIAPIIRRCPETVRYHLAKIKKLLQEKL